MSPLGGRAVDHDAEAEDLRAELRVSELFCGTQEIVDVIPIDDPRDEFRLRPLQLADPLDGDTEPPELADGPDEDLGGAEGESAFLLDVGPEGAMAPGLPVAPITDLVEKLRDPRPEEPGVP